jgi:Domain of Unknown Function (DUF1080)
MTSMRPGFPVVMLLSLAAASAFAQGNQGRGGAGGIPNLTTEQSAAISQINNDQAPQIQKLAAARTYLIAAALAQPRNDAAITDKIALIRTAEFELANARAEAFAKLQSSAKLSADQVIALAAAWSGGRGGGRGRSTSMPHVTSKQANTLTQMAGSFALQSQALIAARGAVTRAALEVPRNYVAMRSKLDAVVTAELALANARADALEKIQVTDERLDAEQLAWLVAAGGSFGGGGFTEPEPYDFNDHRGYISLFDGVSLKGWDGNPKFWRADGGAIVGESTTENPSGNTYIAYRDSIAHDFTLKFEIKVEGSGGSGLQYRSRTGIPWSRPIAANVTANVGPVNLAWMMTGPQADFWPSQIYSGQFYSENTPMGIMAYRGQVVEGAGMGARRLMGTIGDRAQLGTLVKANDWNQFTVIARGGTFIHILNGQLMSVMVDDDPESSNNWSGSFGIEIEATTRVSVRNIWLKKLN